MTFIISNQKNAWGMYEAYTAGYTAYFPTLTSACINAEEVLMKATMNGPGEVRVSGVPYMVDAESVFGMR